MVSCNGAITTHGKRPSKDRAASVSSGKEAAPVSSGKEKVRRRDRRVRPCADNPATLINCSARAMDSRAEPLSEILQILQRGSETFGALISNHMAAPPEVPEALAANWPASARVSASRLWGALN